MDFMWSRLGAWILAIVAAVILIAILVKFLVSGNSNPVSAILGFGQGVSAP